MPTQHTFPGAAARLPGLGSGERAHVEDDRQARSEDCGSGPTAPGPPAATAGDAAGCTVGARFSVLLPSPHSVPKTGRKQQVALSKQSPSMQDIGKSEVWVMSGCKGRAHWKDRALLYCNKNKYNCEQLLRAISLKIQVL